VNAKKLMLSVGGSNSGLWRRTHQTMPLNSSDISKHQKTVVCNWNLLCNGFWISLVLRARIEANQGFVNAKKPLSVIGSPRMQRFFGSMLRR
jgi:hypothetical protein